MKKRKVYQKYKKILADLQTPVGMYSKLRDHFPHSLLLESADYHDRSDSRSFICLDPIAGFEARKHSCTIDVAGEKNQTFTVDDPEAIKTSFFAFIGRFESASSSLNDSYTGLFGYTSYEAVQYMENITLRNPSTEYKKNPDIKYQLFRFVLMFDHFRNELWITEYSLDHPVASEQGIQRVEDLLRLAHAPSFSFKAVGDEFSKSTPDAYKEQVKQGIAHCKRGDVFQVVLSREFSRSFKGDDFNVYRALRSINPSPYLFYFDYGNFRIMGSSPESQLQIQEGLATINPIAGTVQRTNDAREDAALAKQLKDDPKEMAEHVMLVDLARNDLSIRSAEVNVETYAEIQYFSHVIHMVSRVTGKLSAEDKGLEVFMNTFPAGTLSGAPKYRAMEIIDEVETVSRNFYGGAIGFIGLDGSLNHAIIIRSILSKNNLLTYQAGAGIVARSTPEGELEEVNNKVAALRNAIEKAENL
jgi:anthranilate synthase component 1